MTWIAGLWTAAVFAWKGRRIFWALKDLPGLLQEAEGMFGPGSGTEKKRHVLGTFNRSLLLVETAYGRDVVDEVRAYKAASWLIDGTVEMFNAFGLWEEK